MELDFLEVTAEDAAVRLIERLAGSAIDDMRSGSLHDIELRLVMLEMDMGEVFRAAKSRISVAIHAAARAATEPRRSRARHAVGV